MLDAEGRLTCWYLQFWHQKILRLIVGGNYVTGLLKILMSLLVLKQIETKVTIYSWTLLSTLPHCENTVLTIFFFKFTCLSSVWEHSDLMIDQSKKIKWLIKINELTWQLLVPFFRLSCCDQKLLTCAYVHIIQSLVENLRGCMGGITDLLWPQYPPLMRMKKECCIIICNFIFVRGRLV